MAVPRPTPRPKVSAGLRSGWQPTPDWDEPRTPQAGPRFAGDGRAALPSGADKGKPVERRGRKARSPEHAGCRIVRLPKLQAVRPHLRPGPRHTLQLREAT